MVRFPLLVRISPNVEEVTLAVGAPRLGWFRMLYRSARNWTLMRSRMGCQRLMAVSQLNVPGLRKIGSEAIGRWIDECARIEPLSHALPVRRCSIRQTVRLAAIALGAREIAGG